MSNTPKGMVGTSKYVWYTVVYEKLCAQYPLLGATKWDPIWPTFFMTQDPFPPLNISPVKIDVQELMDFVDKDSWSQVRT